MNLPVIRIEIEGLRQNVAMMLTDRSKELDKYVNQVIDKQLNEKWVMEQINAEVHKLIKNAIEGISKNWHLQEAIADVVANSIADKFKESSNE